MESQCKQNKNKNHCYWSDYKCGKITECSQLLASNYNLVRISDEQCRNAMSSCTTIDFRCQESGVNCSDQNLEIQCHWNKNQTQKCYWNGSSCVDKICDNAPSSLKTDSECRLFSDNCTTKLNGGCILSTACSAAQVQDACKTDINGNRCFWSQTQKFCLDITSCEIAPSSYVTNEQCQSILSYCITTKGGGCVQNKGCSSANIKGACTQQIYDQKCFWNEIYLQCQDKKCYNAPSQIYNTHELCSTFMPTCTFHKSSFSCQNRTCSNAPLYIQNDNECELYLPNNNCITKPDGGCMIKTSCSSILQKISCIKDAKENDCYWHADDLVCIDRKCSNAPKKFTTHEQCQKFSNTCTVKASGQCIEWNCENSITQTLCQAKKCTWKNTCQPIFCSLASKSFTTHQQCNDYLYECTLSNLGYGCAPIPLKCEAIILMEACKKKKSVNLISGIVDYPDNSCGWDGTKCVDFGCTTISKNYTKSAECKNVIKDHYCVSANPINGKVQGCIDLPKDCNSRESQDNCEQSGPVGYPVCLWQKSKKLCIEKSCITANIELNLSVFSFQVCKNYLPNCIVNSFGSGCMTETYTSCNHYVQQKECYLTAKSQKCIWSGWQCRNITCNDAPLSYLTDQDCQKFIIIDGICTVGNSGGCQARSNCNSYRSQAQCKFNKDGKQCFWNSTLQNCVDLSCQNIEQTDKFDTHDECFAVDSILQCTVRAINGFTIQGCTERTDCNQYSTQEQCHLNAQNQQCEWNSNYSPPNCQDKSCYTAPFSIITDQDCKNYYSAGSIPCTVAAVLNQNGNVILQGCQPINECSKYIAKEQCLISIKGNICAWIDDEKKCFDRSCSNAPLTFSTDESCRYYLKNCTVAVSGQGCIEVQSQCELYKIKTQCIQDSNDNKCFWTSENKCITRQCDNAPNTITDDFGCNSYLNGCVSYTSQCREKVCEVMRECTTDGQKCVLRGTCLQAQSRYGCITQLDGQQCEWINEQNQSYCTLKSCSTAPNNFTTETDCQGYFHNCIPKSGGGCVTKSICSEVTIQAGCTTAIDGTKCAWFNGVCRNETCGDLKGQNHKMCNLQRSDCTVGRDGYCTNMQKCSLTLIKAACIEGLDGACRWVEGVCYKYDSCQSIQGITHAFCQKISYQCTTDGKKCIGITLCQDTNVNGGCVIGTDGLCSLSKIDGQLHCVRIDCSQFNFTTHGECQAINIYCTTNGQNCINLEYRCENYNQPGCQIDYNHNKCQWITINNIGSCQSVNTKTSPKCSVNNCISKANCSTYRTNSTCFQGGLDGVCLWDTNNCTLMNSCTQGDYRACIEANDRCAWTVSAQGNKCKEHTCQTFYQQTGLCQSIYKLVNTTQIVCQFINNVCQEVDPETLSQFDCFALTKYAYTWNSTSSTCSQCGYIESQANVTQNNSNAQNHSNETTMYSIHVYSFTMILSVILVNI